MVNEVGTHTGNLGLGKRDRSSLQAEDAVTRHFVRDQYRLAHGARCAAIDHNAGLFVDLLIDRIVHQVEVRGGIHAEQGDTVEAVAKLTHALGQDLFVIRGKGGFGDHIGVRSDSSGQRCEGDFDVIIQDSVGHILAHQHGEFFRATRAALKGFFGGFVRAVLPGCLDPDHFAGADLLTGYVGSRIDIAMLKRSANLVKGTLAQIAFDVLVVQHQGAAGGLIENGQYFLETLQISSLRQIVVDDQVAIDGGRH